MSSKNVHAVALGRLGGLASGKVITEAKRAASRINGRKRKSTKGSANNVLASAIRSIADIPPHSLK